jgi:hypothetical protein
VNTTRCRWRCLLKQDWNLFWLPSALSSLVSVVRAENDEEGSIVREGEPLWRHKATAHLHLLCVCVCGLTEELSGSLCCDSSLHSCDYRSASPAPACRPCCTVYCLLYAKLARRTLLRCCVSASFFYFSEAPSATHRSLLLFFLTPSSFLPFLDCAPRGMFANDALELTGSLVTQASENRQKQKKAAPQRRETRR